MLTTHRLIAPRVETPSARSRRRAGSGARCRDAGRPNRSAGSRSAPRSAPALWTYGLVMDTVVRPLHRRRVDSGAERRSSSSSRSLRLGADVPLRALRLARSPRRKADAGLRLHRAERRRRRVASTPGPTSRAAWRPAAGLSWNTVVILVVVDDRPGDAAQDAGGVARLPPRWIRSRRGSRTCAARRCRRSVNTFVLFMPNYACADRRGAAVARAPPAGPAGCARRRRWAAITWSSCSAAAAWAKSGARGTGCSRATRRSSWFARAARRRQRRRELRACCAGSSAKRRRPRRSSSPHTIQLFDFGVTDDRTFYYVMELLDGPRPRVARPRVRAAAGRTRALPAAPGVPLARRRARARARPPRHHAGEHLRLPDGPRLRLRQGARLRAGEVRTSRGSPADAA